MDKKDKKNVYGENVPQGEHEKAEKGIREERTASEEHGNAEAFDETREEMIEERPVEGGMGRKSTPKGDNSQGEYQGVGEDKS